MEILSRSLRVLCQQPLVSFHPKCSKLGLTHLIFADNLMVFVRGDVPSVLAVQQALASFASVSGLHANVEKTHIYFGGVAQEVRAAILTTTGFSEGSFPFRYLGLPLGPSRYSAQLLDAVIFGIENFWCSSVLLPKTVLQQINHLSRNFFWGIKNGERKMQFKSWNNICAPWNKGGFNIKNVQLWNIALLLQWIWKFSNGSTSLWVNWHKKYVLKTNTIWSLASKDQFSSSFKGILAARDVFLTKSGSSQVAEGLLDSWVKGGKLTISKIYEYLLASSPEDRFSVFFIVSIVPSHRVVAILVAQRRLEVWTTLTHWQRLPVSNFDLLDLMKWSYDSSFQVGWAAALFRTTLAAAIHGFVLSLLIVCAHLFELGFA
ncbi:uncharacterized protein LOC141620527 [Silene latifolia]|uniref:uncharacterized protein LOC141620527 n=1 Tax=Silene latifolia TaxID=37657 RepID=UPI003D7830A4